uniref:Putative constitutive coactivator of peroxisome proliferator-activated receptor gamma n=1 Tax=Tabanus bromius TaxID=304241 RepID=A0A0K8TLN5_TABBR
MGVRHLHTYICNQVPNGVSNVDLALEAEKYRKKYGSNPILVLDVLTMQSLMYTNSHEVCLSGRYNLCNERAHRMFSKLKSLNYKLICFIDGPPQLDKMKTCLDRRNDSYDKAIKVLDLIDSGTDLTQPITGIQVPNLLPYFSNFIQIAMEYGEMHASTLSECDLEIADFANSVGAMAIISNDTDFLIYEGDWRFWSANHLNLETFCTIEFNRHSLRTHLKLNSNQMCLFATLGGNDILKYNDVVNFHRRIGSNRDKFLRIADVIRSLNSYPPRLRIQDLKRLSHSVFGPGDREYGIHLIQQSMKSYSYLNMPRQHEDPLIDALSKNAQKFNFVIVANRPYIIQLFFFDYRDKYFTPFYDLVLPLIKRQMGILLCRFSGDRSRTFYCKTSHETPYRQQKLRCDFPNCDVPPLQELLFTPFGKSSQLDDLRIQLVCWQISPKLNINILKSLKNEAILTALNLFYLVEKKQITKDEADCLLLAVNCPSNMVNQLKYEDMKAINGRDARVAFLFTRMYDFIRNCISAVGLREFCSLVTFDGLYFHHLRKNWRSNPGYIDDLLKQYEDWRIYLTVFD